MIKGLDNKKFLTVSSSKKLQQTRQMKHLVQLGKIVVPITTVEYIRFKTIEFQKNKTQENLETKELYVNTYFKTWENKETISPELLTLRKKEFSTIQAHIDYSSKPYSLKKEVLHYYKYGEGILDRKIAKYENYYLEMELDSPSEMSVSSFLPDEDLSIFDKFT